MNKQQIINALQAKKTQGMNAKEAACEVWKEIHPKATRQVENPFIIFAEALAEVFDPLTPLSLAIILKAIPDYTDKDVVDGVYDVFKTITAIKLGEVILDKDVYPMTTKERMKELLSLCEYSQADVNQAVKILYPITFVVQSTKPWQDTGLIIESTEIATIEANNDKWFISHESGYVDAGGGPRRINFTSYALPGAPEGALIARIGTHVFLAGKRCETPRNQGKLELCPNDDLNGSHGLGLSDNKGSISVKIKVHLG